MVDFISILKQYKSPPTVLRITMTKSSILLLLAGVAGTGIFAALYTNKASALEAAMSARSSLLAEKASLEKHAAELKALAQSKPGVLAPAATVVTNSASAVELESLRKELADARSELAKLKEPTAERAPRDNGGDQKPPSAEDMATRMKQRMEEWKQRDPEGFERMQKSAEERRTEIDQSFKERLTFLETLDVNGLSPEYYSNHTNVVTKLKEMQAAFAAMNTGEPFNPGNWEQGRQIFENMRGLEDAMKKEREVLLADLASSAGYQGDKAKEFVAYIDTVNKLTSMPRPSRGRGGFGGGDRGGDRGQGGGDNRGPAQ
jgi:hypothetical protein